MGKGSDAPAVVAGRETGGGGWQQRAREAAADMDLSRCRLSLVTGIKATMDAREAAGDSF